MKQRIIIFLLFPFFIWGQTGGKNAYPFLDMADNARSLGLGNRLITVYDDDLNLGIKNPASFNSLMDNSVGFSQALLAGGIYHGTVAYAKDITNIGTGAVHLRYNSYGKMVRRDVTGEEMGTFSAGDFALGFGLGRSVNKNLSIGANFNLIWSQLEAYSSMGLSVNIAGMFISTDELTTVSAVVRNVGAQLTTYNKQDRAPLPVDAMIGVSHRLEHAPFRFSIVMHHLNKWDLSYYDPNEQPKKDPLTGEMIPVKTAGFGEKLGRHFIFQVESIIGKMVHLRAAFDYNQRMEMLVQNRPGMGGFSFGAGLHFKRFSLDYGILIYSSAGFQNMISLRTGINTWKK